MEATRSISNRAARVLKSTITTDGIQGLVVTRSFNSLEAAESWKTYVSGMFAAVEGQYVITAI
jgi:hypothetical protein